MFKFFTKKSNRKINFSAAWTIKATSKYNCQDVMVILDENRNEVYTLPFDEENEELARAYADSLVAQIERHQATILKTAEASGLSLERCLSGAN